MKKQLRISQEDVSPYEVVLTNGNGDTFTYNPQSRNGEELEDFLRGAAFEHPQPLDAGEEEEQSFLMASGEYFFTQSYINSMREKHESERKKWEASITAKQKEWEEEKAELVEGLLKIRDEIVKGDYDEAYHILYSMASPELNKVSPWGEWEKLLNKQK